MKKLLLFKKLIIVLLLAGMSLAGWAQVLLYEPFDYATPAFIGGNGGAVGSTTNNWITHSVTTGPTNTVNIEDGNLTYPGLASSSGNKVFLFSNRNATSRDVNRGFTSTSKVLYYSALVNIVDTVQLKTTGDYFLHFGATAGADNTILGARLAVKSVGTATNFRFMILNISGGTPVYSDNGADLNIGTTYLVVVKYDISAPVTVATMWVNPAFGATEPVGGISNSTGNATTFTTFVTGSICLRNGSATPKANIDEIRVGATWADVTPVGAVGISKRDQASSRQTAIYPNPAKSFFNVKAPEGDYLVSINNSIGSLVKSTELNSNGKIEMADLRPGIYYVTVENEKTNLKEVHKLIVK
jgi:hypothetical protein